MSDIKTQQGYSRIFKKKTDLTFKYNEFELNFAEFMIGYVQCYPHLVEKQEIPHMPEHEMWVFKFWVEGDPIKEQLRQQEFKIQMIKK